MRKTIIIITVLTLIISIVSTGVIVFFESGSPTQNPVLS